MKTILTAALLATSACTLDSWIARGPRPPYQPAPRPTPVYLVDPNTGAPVRPAPQQFRRPVVRPAPPRGGGHG